METTTSTSTSTARRKAKPVGRAPLPKTSRHLNNLLEWYANFSSRSLKHVNMHYSHDAFFKDPFTEAYTAEDIRNYYEHTLSKLTDVRFVFENVLEDHRQAFVTWTMSARFMGREFSVQGSSHFKFDTSGLCEYHRDYFDSSAEIFEQLPVVGYLFKGLKRVLN